jgi:hypothetical protein
MAPRLAGRVVFVRVALEDAELHDVETCDAGSLQGWVDPALAIDIGRAHRLETAGYTVWTQTIPSAITPKNRLLLGALPAPLEQED